VRDTYVKLNWRLVLGLKNRRDYFLKNNEADPKLSHT
jgi:hypothetical protein